MSLGPHHYETRPQYYPVPPVVDRKSVLLGTIGTAVALVIGPLAVYFIANDRSSWFWTIVIGSAIHGAVGLSLGIAALRSNRRNSHSSTATPGKILGVVSVVGGAIGLTNSLFFLTIWGLVVSLAHH